MDLTQNEAAPLSGDEATLLGVFDDRTPEVVDPEGGRVMQEGDELVVAARPGRMESLHSAA